MRLRVLSDKTVDLARPIETVMERHEHLVLADVGDQGRRAARHTTQRAHDLRRGRGFVSRRRGAIDQSARLVVSRPLIQPRPPGCSNR